MVSVSSTVSGTDTVVITETSESTTTVGTVTETVTETFGTITATVSTEITSTETETVAGPTETVTVTEYTDTITVSEYTETVTATETVTVTETVTGVVGDQALEDGEGIAAFGGEDALDLPGGQPLAVLAAEDVIVEDTSLIEGPGAVDVPGQGDLGLFDSYDPDAVSRILRNDSTAID